MHQEIEYQKQLIERSGIDLLPGIAVAFLICMLTMASLVLAAWWITFTVLAVLFLVTGSVVWVVLKLADDAGAEAREH